MDRFEIRMFAVSALFFLGAAGCEQGAEMGVRTERRDSAGVVIVENSGEIGPDGGGWRVSPDPLLSIGTFQGDSLQQLYQVQGAARLGDGRIAIANAGSGAIRFYDGQGRYLSGVGRKGEGPGEFQQPVLAGVLPGGPSGDTLVVVDTQLRRISLVHPDAGFLGSIRISEDVGGGAFPQGMFADGAVVLGGGFFFSSDGGMELSSGFSRRETQYRSVGRDGEMRTDFGTFPGSEFFMEVRTEPGGAVSMRARLIPFGKYAMQAVGPSSFFYGSGDDWEVRVFDPSGPLQRIVRMDRVPAPVRAEDLDAYIQRVISQATDPSQGPEIRSDYAEMPTPERFPAYAGLDADPYGYLWVERYRPPGETIPVFDVLDPEGALVGWVELPPETEVLRIGEDYVLTLYRDELDVEYVGMYGLTRPGLGTE